MSLLHERWSYGLSHPRTLCLTGAQRAFFTLSEDVPHSWQVWNGTTAVWTLSALAAGSVLGAAFSLPFWFAGKPRLPVSRKLMCMFRHSDTLPLPACLLPGLSGVGCRRLHCTQAAIGTCRTST